MNLVLFYTFASSEMKDHRVEKWLLSEADVGERCLSRLASFLISNKKQTSHMAYRAKMATALVLAGTEKQEDLSVGQNRPSRCILIHENTTS